MSVAKGDDPRIPALPLPDDLQQHLPLSRETREWLATSVLPLLALAQLRISEKELKQLEAIVATLPDYPPERGSSEFRIRLWLTIAQATREPLIVQGVREWARAMRERERLTGVDATGPAQIVPKAKYLGLILALRRGSGAPELWTSVITHVID